MPAYTLNISQECTLSREQLFAAMSDLDYMGKLMRTSIQRVKEGDGNRVGSVHRMNLGPLGFEETVTAVVPNESIEYRISKGASIVRNHRGSIIFNEAAKGARVTWNISYESLPVIGLLICTILRLVLTSGLKRLR